MWIEVLGVGSWGMPSGTEADLIHQAESMMTWILVFSNSDSVLGQSRESGSGPPITVSNRVDGPITTKRKPEGPLSHR